MSSRHAPRGPVKARPIDESTHETPKCTAKSSRTGKPCQKYPINGGTVCRTHGGAAPQVKAAAEKRLADLRPKAITRLDWLMDQEAFPTVILGAVKDVLDRNDGKPHESLAVEHSGAVDLVTVLRSRQARREKTNENAPSVQAGA